MGDVVAIVPETSSADVMASMAAQIASLPPEALRALQAIPDALSPSRGGRKADPAEWHQLDRRRDQVVK